MTTEQIEQYEKAKNQFEFYYKAVRITKHSTEEIEFIKNGIMPILDTLHLAEKDLQVTGITFTDRSNSHVIRAAFSAVYPMVSVMVVQVNETEPKFLEPVGTRFSMSLSVFEQLYKYKAPVK